MLLLFRRGGGGTPDSQRGGDDAWFDPTFGPIFAETLDEFIARNEPVIAEKLEVDDVETIVEELSPQLAESIIAAALKTQSLKKNAIRQQKTAQEVAKVAQVLTTLRQKIDKTAADMALEEDLMMLMMVLANDEIV